MQEDYRIRSSRLSQKLATLNCLVKLRSVMALASVADPGCLSRIVFFIDSWSRIQQQQQNRRRKKISCHSLFVATNFTKFKIILFLNKYRNFFWQIDIELQYFLPKQLSLSSSNYGLGIWDPRKTYLGSRGLKSTGSRLGRRNTGAGMIIQWCWNVRSTFFFKRILALALCWTQI